MLKLSLKRPDGALVILALSAKNIEKLQQDQPIKVAMSELGFEGEVWIVAGDTEESMMADFERAGLLPASKADMGVPQ